MQFFDPDKYAVFAEPLMSRLTLESHPWAVYGLVRDVQISEDDLPMRCVCFTTRDMGQMLDINPPMFHKYLDTWGWWTPTFNSANVYAQQEKSVRVYLYPEALIVLDEYRKAQEFGTQLGSRTSPRIAARVNKALALVRNQVKEMTYE